MAEDKAPKKAKAKKPAAKPGRKGDIKIVIGAKASPPQEPGVQLWALDGDEVTEKGDRSSVAYLTTQQLFELGWIRRKY